MLIKASVLIFSCGIAFSGHVNAQASLKEISDKVADLSCDNSNQCKAIGVGKMQCGGPSVYMKYSTKRVNESDLVTLVGQYNNSITFPPDSVGICIVPQAPVSACVASRCSSETTTPIAHSASFAGNDGALVVDLPAVVYYQAMKDVVSDNGVHIAEATGKLVYQVRLVSFIDEKDGVLKFKVEWLYKMPETGLNLP